MDVSIVMPCLNEEETVGKCVEKARVWLTGSGLAGEIIVVDNGSTDRSVAIAETAGATVLHESNPGYGNAYLHGLAAAQGEVILMGDSDDTYSFSDAGHLLGPLEDGYDLVIGNRFAGGIAKGAMPWSHQHIGTPLINAMLRVFTGLPVGDSQSGMRAFTRGAYQRMALRSEGMEFASEMILNASRKGLRVTEVPIPYYPRLGKSKLNTIRDGWRHLRFLLLSSPNALFLLPGLIFVMLGLATMVASFASPEGLAVGSLTWQPVFASTILLVVGTNAIAYGSICSLFLSSGSAVSQAPRRMRSLVAIESAYKRGVKLEISLVAAAAVVVAGLLLDAVLLGVWLSDADFPRKLQFAGLAQSLILIGLNIGLASFLSAALDPMRRPVR